MGNVAWNWFGTDNANSPFYLFYSGIFAVAVFTVGIATNVYVHLRKHNCHEPRCLRLGRFPVEGTPWVACHLHHPAPPVKGGIRHQHRMHLGDKPGPG